MPLILPSNSISAGGYEVDNSLRFESSSTDHLSRSKSSSETSTTIGTFSFWVKRCETGATTSIYSNEVENGNNRGLIVITNTDNFYINNSITGQSDRVLSTTQLFTDLSAWSHFVVAFDTNQGTASNRVKIYHNGNQITTFGTAVYPNQSENLKILEGGQTNKELVGKIYGADNSRMYLAEFHHIDGQALTPTDFGEFDENSGIWKPIEYSGTYGNNGFYLDFENSGSLGADVSGNGNNFTVNNLTSIDQTTDTPTNNFCTFNSLVNVPYTTFSQGNTFVDLTSTGSSSHHTNYGNIAFSSGKWYWEAKALGGTKYTIGLSDANNQSNYQQVAGTNLIVGNHANSYVSGDAIGWYSTTLYKNGSTIASSLSGIVTNDIMMVAVDCDNGKIYFGKNGTWRVANSTTFDSTQNDTTFTTGEFYVSAFSNEDCDWSVNWGNPAYSISSGNSDGNGYGNFEYSVPENYYSLNVKNLAEFG